MKNVADVPCAQSGADTPPEGGVALSWYCFTATYKCVAVDRPRKRHLWQRMFMLLRAPENRHPDALRQRAEAIARGEEHEYVNMHGVTMRWVFHQVECIEELFDAELKEGSQVFWEFFERVDKAPS